MAAPTGAGKTVVGEFAAWLALGQRGRTFYTTPIKALSNQKYSDFVALHGAADVGLLTGDNSLNGDAPIVVMTTEVLRNMIYEDSPALADLHYVVLDEVHYLQDRYRGAVWEEILIHLPVEVQTVSLSATVSNAEEFAEWQQTLRGQVEVIIEEQRPVEIRHWYFASDELLPMFVRQANGELLANPRAREFDRRRRRGGDRPLRGGRRMREKRARVPLRSEVVDRLETEAMLPAIYFIFSRAGCDDAVRQCLRAGLRLTSAKERKAVTDYVEGRTIDLAPNELDVLGYGQWLAGLQNGIGAHHAGLIPPFKETVEELFAQNLVKAVFATETLALGINMPARSVVIENLTKFTGEKHELMTAGQYTQLAGRAGRRGIDEIGHSIVLMQRFTPFDTITRLASTRTYPLKSSFQPSYNMAVNLVRSYDKGEAEHLVNSSFAQFQADRDVVQIEQTRERLAAYLTSYKERMRCDLGDIEEYRALLDRLQSIEDGTAARRHRGDAVTTAINALEPGDVVDVEGGKRRGRYAVIEVAQRRAEGLPRVLALSEERSMVRLTNTDFRQPPRPVGRVDIPKGFHLRDARARRHLARRVAGLDASPPPLQRAPARASHELEALRSELQAHPVRDCPELKRHLHFAGRAESAGKEIAKLDRRIGRRTATLARRFEQVLGVLARLGYLEGWELTDKGEMLTSVYNEADLLVVESLQREVLHGLSAPELAAVASTLVYETRGPEQVLFEGMPTHPSAEAWAALRSLWRRIHKDEARPGVELTREPDPGFAELAFMWAAGEPLERVLGEGDAPGDFVRTTKQLIDLLRMLEDVAVSSNLRATLREAIAGLHRGVVAYSSLEV